jgi:glyceraldehyde-3-phosphate dehydrogenase/erythrose-4-phosphate dehydrogenase
VHLLSVLQEYIVVGSECLLENDYLAYMLKYDTAQGRFDGDIAVEGDNFIKHHTTDTTKTINTYFNSHFPTPLFIFF